MNVRIKRRQETADAPGAMALLDACHRRIEHFLEVLSLVTEQSVPGAMLSDSRHHVLETALEYFRELLPKHHEDEEISLFPRMRAAGEADLDAALKLVAQLEAEHRAADRLHAEVDVLGRQWLAAGQLSSGMREALMDKLAALQESYRRHIATEDQQVFRPAARHLGAEELSAMAQEMAARRGVRQIAELREDQK